MPDPGRVPAVRRPGPAPAEGAGILGLHPAAETLLAALRIQVRAGRLVRRGIRPGLPPHLQPRLMVLPGGHPGRTGGLWLWMILVLSLFQAVVVPSGFRTTVQPHW